MKKGKIITGDNEIKEILLNAKTIAIVGVSPKPGRDSHMVAGYLKDAGYKIIPVRPAQKEILGEKAYGNLEQIREPVDIVDMFRRSDQIEPHAQEEKNAKRQSKFPASAVAKTHLFAGGADAVLPSARNVWKKIYGGCPVME